VVSGLEAVFVVQMQKRWQGVGAAMREKVMVDALV